MQKKTKKSVKVKKPKVADVETLLEQGTDLLASQDFDKGLKKLRRAYQIAPSDVEVAFTLGSALAETGNGSEAIEVLKQAVALEPNEGFEKFMYLGQLLEGEEAITCTRQGLTILFQIAQEDPDVRPQLAEGMCSLSEQILTNAAEVTEAMVQECAQLLEKAVEIDPEGPQPLLSLASLKNETGQQDEALQHLRTSVSKWLPPPPGEGEGEANNDISSQLEVELPSFEFRFETAKLLLDLDSTTDMAVRVLESLIVERDALPDVWHMLALAHHGGCEFQLAIESLEKAHEALNKATDMDPREARSKSEELEDLRSAITESAANMDIELEDDDDDEDEDDMDDDDMEDKGEKPKLSYKEKLVAAKGR